MYESEGKKRSPVRSKISLIANLIPLTSNNRTIALIKELKLGIQAGNFFIDYFPIVVVLKMSFHRVLVIERKVSDQDRLLLSLM
ncbi:hypothetical protein H1P_5350001 [Hyella patelloides LEGE 07179]|uniref:Uncharacterized protein n=1 Tax=Hyella patelloides LEGE 07179 TaxID=945734 RepID=A0A563W020_9CYAN|nr:hypothetical protein [Hyella patelloides]VEP17058.1 hypothetical protein H1P_5350001 [Hyella patelloides LEGE 07179]